MHRFAPSLMPLAALALASCGPSQGGGTTAATPADAPGETAVRSIPLGQPPGEPVSPASAIANPYEGDAAAVAEGKGLFASMNCVYCHGTAGSGLIGPALDSHGWRYGGTPAQLYNSIHDGRPKGMPAWGARLPPDQIWKLVAYLQTLANATGNRSTTGGQAAEQDSADAGHQGIIDAQREQRAQHPQP